MQAASSDDEDDDEDDKYLTTEKWEAERNNLLTNFAALLNTTFDTKLAAPLAELKNVSARQTAIDRTIGETMSTIGELKRSNDEWMKSQLARLKEHMVANKTTVDNYFKDGLDTIKTEVMSKVGELTADAIKDAQQKLATFSSRTVEYEDTMKQQDAKSLEMMEQLREYEAKYGSTSKNMKTLQDSMTAAQKQMATNNETVAHMSAMMEKYRHQMEEHLDVLGEMRTLSDTVESRHTDLDLTIKDFNDRSQLMLDGIKYTEDEINEICTKMEELSAIK
jgi:chromosome segregation ATPase